MSKKEVIHFLGDIRRIDNTTLDYEMEEDGEWTTYDDEMAIVMDVVFRKGTHFDKEELIKTEGKYTVDKWIKDGICKIIKAEFPPVIPPPPPMDFETTKKDDDSLISYVMPFDYPEQNISKGDTILVTIKEKDKIEKSFATSTNTPAKQKSKHTVTKKDAIALNKELDKAMGGTEKKSTIMETWAPTKHDPLKDEKERLKEATLDHVYKVTEKYLHINDRHRIDIILATYISNGYPGTPLWLYIVGASGDWKSAFLRSLEGCTNVIKLDQITKNTLASGLPKVADLGSILANTDTILLFPDLAALTSKNIDEKNAIWGQMRNLYDGFINKMTGSGVTKAYEGCHVSMLAGATDAIRNEILIHAQLGTRELLYDTEAQRIDNKFKMTMALQNEEYEEEMSKEIHNAVSTFLLYHKAKVIPIPDDITEFIMSEADRLSILRASGTVDRIYQELINPISPEVPTRAVKQFKRIYMALKSLDPHYPDSRCKEIITHIVDSSGNKVRQLILNNLNKYISTGWLRIEDVQQNTKLGRKTVKSQLEMLWNMNIVNKEVREDVIGGWTTEKSDGQGGTYESRKGGKVEKVAYYQINHQVASYHDNDNQGKNPTDTQQKEIN